MRSRTKRELVAQERTPARQAHGSGAAMPPGDEIVLRLLASAMGLPRVCVFKACRRRKRCFGPGLLCAEHHRGLVAKRIEGAIRVIAPGK